MKKKIIIIGIICLIIIGIVLFFFLRKEDNIDIKLSEKYYNLGEFIDITSDNITSLKNDTYLLFVYNDYCAFQIPCDKVFKEFMEEYKIDIVSIPFIEFKKTDFYNTVLYAPSVILISRNKIITYLDANSDDDINKYQDSKEFANWIKKYTSLKK